MKKKFLVSSMALLVSLLAVGCSNNASQYSSPTRDKVHKTSKKASSKTSSSNNSSSESSSSQDDNSSDVKSNGSSGSSSSTSSENTESNSTSSSNAVNSSSSASMSSSTQARSNLSESNFRTVLYDTIKRNGYPASTTIKDFNVMQAGNQIDVAEKKTGTIVAHYTIKNGHLYYYDVATDQQVQVN